MAAGDTQPTRPLPPMMLGAPPPPRRRRRVWPWIVAAIVVAGVLVAAWFVAEAIARGIVERTVREQAITTLGLPEDQPIDVEVAGAVLPQLVGGSLDSITVASDDVTVGDLEGDITVHAEGIALRGEPVADSVTAAVRLDEEQLRRLVSGVDGFPVDSLGLAAPDVTVSTDLRFLGLTVPVGVALTPSAVDGDIVLSPSQLELAGSEVSADDLRDRFGALADTVLRDWTVCIAEYIPAGMTLTGIVVEGEEIIAEVDIDGRIVSDPDLQENGTCAS